MIRRPPRSTLFPTRRSSDLPFAELAAGADTLQAAFALGEHRASLLARTGQVELGKHGQRRSEEHTSELQSRLHLVCRLLLEKKKKNKHTYNITKHTLATLQP